MTQTRYHMANHLDRVDDMVLALRSEVEAVLPMEALFRFELAVSEALTNLAKHARPANEAAQVHMALTTQTDRAEITICDPEGAEPFDVVAAAPDLSNVDLMAEDGRGLGLIMTCADDVTYGRNDQCNGLTLTFAPRA